MDKMERKFKVTANGKELFVSEGTLLSEALKIEKPCAGRGICGKCKVQVNGKDELACQYRVRSDLVVVAPETGEIFSETGVSTEGEADKNLCLALDVGTTTLALAVVSLETKKAVKVVVATNPQRLHGADVISRIEFCRTNSVTPLQKLLVDEINGMIERLGVGEIENMYVAANTTMLHTLFGEDCSAMGVAPYTPVFLESRTEKGETLGIKGIEKVTSLPSVSAFVGADIVSGLGVIGNPEKGKYNLLIDLGTNAEVVLWSDEKGVATAAAAGPCFEGANISHGMSATDGAIYAAEFSGGKMQVKTINDKRAKGVCGTGLIDAVSELLRFDIIDETGFMEDDFLLAEGVWLTCEDVRQYQLAKSAVYSAVLCLMSAEGVEADDLETLYISGGFSTKVNIESAVRSGLLPAEFKDKIKVLGNSSLQGAVKYATEGVDLEEFVEKIRYADLSADPLFANLFVENMMFG